MPTRVTVSEVILSYLDEDLKDLLNDWENVPEQERDTILKEIAVAFAHNLKGSDLEVPSTFHRLADNVVKTYTAHHIESLRLGRALKSLAIGTSPLPKPSKSDPTAN